MRGRLSGLGWMFVLRGIAAILFGIMAFIWPGLTAEVLVLLFGAYVLVDGIFTLISIFTDRNRAQSRVAALLEGLLSVGVGIFTFIRPDLIAVSLLVVIGIWAILTGILEIAAAIRLRKVIEHEFWLGLGGVLSILAGVLLLIQPGAGALALIWVIGGYAIMFGIIMLALAFRFFGQARQSDDNMPDRSSQTPTPTAT